MSDFGFDPYIISNYLKQGNDASNNDMRTLADVKQTKVKTQTDQYHLQREQNLADIVSQNAGAFSSNPYAQSLAQGGYGQQAFEAQQQALQMRAQQFEMGQKILGFHKGIVTSQLSAANTPDEIKAIGEQVRQAGSEFGDVAHFANIPGQNASPQDWENWKKGFMQGTMSPQQQAEVSAKQAANRKYQNTEIPGQGVFVDQNTNQVTPINTAGDNSPILQGDQLKQAAKFYIKTGGDMPDLGRDPGGMNHSNIIKMAHELEPNANLAANKATYSADKGSIESFQKQVDYTKSFIVTLDKNIKVLEGSMGKLKSNDYPLLNRLLRGSQEKVQGNGDLAAMKAALQTVSSEVAKINSGTQGGSPPLATLEEAMKNLPDDATPKQIQGALSTYKADSINRIAAMREQLGEIKGRLGGGSGAKPATKPRPSAPVDQDPERTAALRWVRDHSRDPRAAKILQRLGLAK